MLSSKRIVYFFSLWFFLVGFSNAVARQWILIDSGTDLTAIVFEAQSTYELSPGAVYEVDSSVIVSNDHVTIIGNGATIKKTGIADALRITGSHCRITGIEIDGNGQDWCGIFVTGSHNVMEGITSHHNGGHGIGLDGQAADCRYNRIINCMAKDNDGIGFSMNTAGNNILTGNVAINNGLEGFTCDGMMHTGPSYGNIFANNVCQGNRGGIGGFGIDFAIDNIFTGNVIDGNSQSGLKTQNNQGPCFGNTFTGNVFVNNGGYGVEFYGGSGGVSHDNSLSGNTFRNNAAGDIFVCKGCYNN